MSQEKIFIKINERLLEAEAGKTVLEVARAHGLFIPSLCELEGLPAFAGCRLCLVEVAGKPGWLPACQIKVEEGMEVITSTPELEELRRNILELILSEHPYFCLLCREKSTCQEAKVTISRALEPGGCVFCEKDGNCQLQKVVSYLKIEAVSYTFRDRGLPLWDSDPFIRHNPNLCLLCGRCVRVCEEVRGEGVLTFAWRGQKIEVSTAFGRSLRASDCSFCGACLEVCPVAAFSEKGVGYDRQPPLENVKYLCSLCGSVCEMEAELSGEKQLRRIRPSASGQPSFVSGCARGRFGLKELLRENETCISARPENFEERNFELTGLSQKIKDKLRPLSPSEIAFAFDGQSSLEELVSFLEVAGQFKTENIFWFYPENFLTRLGEFEKDHNVNFGRRIEEEKISGIKTFLVVDSDLKNEALKLWLQVRRNLSHSVRLITLGSGYDGSELWASIKLKCSPGTESLALALLHKKIIEKKTGLDFVEGHDRWREKLSELPEEILLRATGLEPSKVEEAAGWLLNHQPAIIFFGQRLLRQERWTLNLIFLWNLGLAAGAEVRPVTVRANEVFVEKLASRYSVKSTADLKELSQKVKNGAIKAVFLQGFVPLPVKPEFLVRLTPGATRFKAEADVIWPVADIISAAGHFSDVFGQLKRSTRTGGELNGSQKLLELLSGEDAQPEKTEIRLKALAREIEEASCRSTERQKYIGLELSARELETFASAEEHRTETEGLDVFLEPNLDCYAGHYMGKAGTNFSLIRPLEAVWLHPEDISGCGLEDGQSVMLEIQGEEIRMKIKADWRVPKGTAVVRPDLSQAFWLEIYPHGLVKGKIKKDFGSKNG
ncbi:MAG: 2Fe-2S iron-sulfur cluster-binding protein [Candidatus Saccharicenans sp.]